MASFLFAGQNHSENTPDIVSLGRVNAAPFWIFYRGPEPLDRLPQLKGKRAYVTVATGDFVDRILAANGVKPDDIVRSTAVGAQAAAKVLQNDEVDVVILHRPRDEHPAIAAL